MVEPEFVLGGLKAFFDAPACPLDLDQSLDGGVLRTPGGKIGQFAIADAAADQKTTRPCAGNRCIVFRSIEVGERTIGPIIEPLPLGAMACGERSPDIGRQGRGNVFRLASYGQSRRPGAEPMVGMDTEHVAFSGTAERHLDLADTIDAVGRDPGKGNIGRDGLR